MDRMPSQRTSKRRTGGIAKPDSHVVRMGGNICGRMPAEECRPAPIKATRKRRIAAGAGVQVQEVNRLLNQFEQMRDMMKKMKGGGMMKMMKRLGGGMGGMGGKLGGLR